MNKSFTSHPNLSDEINVQISVSEAESGAHLDKLAVGRKLSVITKHRVYIIEHRKDGFYIKGHPKYCPEFAKAIISGSTWGGSMIKVGFVGIGMRLEFYPESYLEGKRMVLTSEIQDVLEESNVE